MSTSVIPLGWQVTVDNNSLYTYESPYDQNNKYVPEMLLDLELNKAGQFTFKIMQDHPRVNDIKILKSEIKVVDERGNLRFLGRPISDSIDFYNIHTFVCEGALAYLNDVIIRPFSATVSAANGLEAIKGEFTKIVQFYNDYAAPSNRKIRVGDVTVAKPRHTGTAWSFWSKEYMTAMEYIQTKLINKYGGTLQARSGVDSDTGEKFIYLDYLADITDTGTQGITFAQNLIDIVTDTNGTSICTAVIPIGKDEAGNTLTIDSIADGAKSETISKTGDYIYSPDAVSRYGHISQVVNFDDATDADTLLEAAMDYFVLARTIHSKTTFTAVDLHYATGVDVPSFRVGEVIPITSAPHQTIHGFNNTALIRKLNINLLNPAESKLTVETTVTL